MSVEMVIPWRRGSYVAKLSGPDDKYGLTREFEEGRAVKANGGRLHFQLDPGFYEVRERWGAERSYVRVDELTTETVPGDLEAYIGIASAGPLPGEPGEWNSDTCWCGEPLAAFDPQGFPKCSLHEDAADFDMPEAVTF